MSLGRNLAFSALLCPTTAFAQSRSQIVGTVRDENGAPIFGAQVELRTHRRVALTDSSGSYSLGLADPGKVTVIARRLGFRPQEVQLHVGGTLSEQHFVLEAIPRVLAEVQVRERSSLLRFTGVVIDGSGAPVPGAHVIASGYSRTLTTDDSGRFSIHNVKRGALPIRVRKKGYKAYFGAVTMLGEREDTIRLPTLRPGLSTKSQLALSGFGRDAVAMLELDERMHWNGLGTTVVTSEQLAAYAGTELCTALARFPAVRAIGFDWRDCDADAFAVVVNGVNPIGTRLFHYNAEDAVMVEIYSGGRDYSRTLRYRTGGLFVTAPRTGRRGTGTVVVVWPKAPLS